MTKKAIYTLKKPVTIDGQNYTEVDLSDLDKLTGEDILAIEQEMQSDGFVIAGMAELSKAYLLYIAARAAKINVQILKKFPISDISKITAMAQTFLLQA